MDYQTQVAAYQTKISELNQIIDKNRWNGRNLRRKIKTILKKTVAK